jgi:hypothetical protein
MATAGSEMRRARRVLPRWAQHWWAWFAAIFVLTFLSFWPSFFSAIVTVKTAIVTHGISAIGWMVLTVIQASLIRSRWRRGHRLVGYASLALAAVLVLSGLQMLRNMILRDGGAAVGIPLLGFKFFYLDITGLALFCVFVALAIRAARRRDIPLHLRLITCTAVIPLEAALERTYIYGLPRLVPNWEVTLIAANLTLILLTTVLVAGEWWYGRLRWPFSALLSYYVVMAFTTDPVGSAQWFHSATFWFASL